MFNTFRGLKRDSYSWDKYQPVKILNVVQFVFVLSFCREEQKNRQKYLCHKEIYNLKIRCNIRSCAINIRKHILSKQHLRYTLLHNIIYIHFLPCWQHFEHIRSSRKYIFIHYRTEETTGTRRINDLPRKWRPHWRTTLAAILNLLLWQISTHSQQKVIMFKYIFRGGSRVVIGRKGIGVVQRGGK